jgi:hypothetical protein
MRSDTSARAVAPTLDLGLDMLRFGYGKTPKDYLMYCPLGL